MSQDRNIENLRFLAMYTRFHKTTDEIVRTMADKLVSDVGNYDYFERNAEDYNFEDGAIWTWTDADIRADHKKYIPLAKEVWELTLGKMDWCLLYLNDIDLLDKLGFCAKLTGPIRNTIITDMKLDPMKWLNLDKHNFEIASIFLEGTK